MAGRLTRAEQVGRNRELVLDAARRVFLVKGYVGATVDAIADEAGFSKGVVYSQFGAKADLFLALLERRIEERALQNAARTGEGLLALVHTVARRSTEDAEWGRLLIEFRAAAARDPELNARYAALHERTIEHLERAVVESGAPSGIEPRQIAYFLLALDAGITIERAASPGAVPDDLVFDLLGGLMGVHA